MNSIELSSDSVESTVAIGKIIGSELEPGIAIGLSGDLGAGKTEMARGIAESLGISSISSPTYVIESQYKLPGSKSGLLLSHWDLYRVQDREFYFELAHLKLSKKVFCLVEWPEKVPGIEDLLDIKILIRCPRLSRESSRNANEDQDTRIIEIVFVDSENPLVGKIKEALKAR